MAVEDNVEESNTALGGSPPEDDSSLEALVNQERTFAYQQLQAELGREPTQEEADEWLNAHTESY